MSELLKIFNWIRINEQTLHSRRSPRGSKFLLSLSLDQGLQHFWTWRTRKRSDKEGRRWAREGCTARVVLGLAARPTLPELPLAREQGKGCCG